MSAKDFRYYDDLSVHRAWHNWDHKHRQAMMLSPDDYNHVAWSKEQWAAHQLVEAKQNYHKLWREIWYLKAQGEGFVEKLREWYAKNGRLPG